jgi:DNA-binding GntR family transcriptional regulator
MTAAPGSGADAVVSRTTVRDQVRRILRAQITSGVLVPGEIYSATVLGEQLGVSATPVREAMLDFANANLVEPVRNRGFRILTVSPEQLEQIVQVRLWLEVPAMEVVAARASDEQLAALAPLAEATVAAQPGKDLAAWVMADHAFHLTALGLTGNDRLVKVVAALRDQTQLLGLPKLDELGALERSAQEHIDLVARLQARDGAAAMELMARHLEHARGIWIGREE